MKKIWNNNYFKAFILSLILGAIIIVPRIILGGGVFNIIDDFNYQELPFNMFINDWLKNGNGMWNWYNDLGSNFIGSFSFYNLASPFVLIGLLFPSNFIPYLIGPIFILKYAVAGLTSFMFLKRYVKNPKYALVGSLLYAFSGFQITNMLFYHFHDVVAFFPLVLWSLDKFVLDNKHVWFALSVALMVFTNYFFFIGVVVFTLIYFVIKLLTSEYKITWKKFGLIVLEAVLGVGISAIILLPSLIFVMGNPRVGDAWSLVDAFVFSIGRYVDVIRAFIMPNEVMTHRAMVVSSNYRSVEIFLPFIGSLFMFSYVFKNKKSWITKIILVSIVCMFIPILNSMFTAFQTHYYARWFFMPILLFSLASIKAMEDDIKIKSGVILTSVIALIGLIVGIFYESIAGSDFVRDQFYFIVIISLFIICLITNIILRNKKKREDRYVNQILIGIFIFVAIMGNLFFYQYMNSPRHDENYVDNFLNAGKYLDIENKDYERIDAASNCYQNLSTVLNKPVIKSFNSSLNGSLFDFYYSIGNRRYVETLYDKDDFDLRNFLSVKYFITCNDSQRNYYEDYYNKLYESGIYSVFENPEYYPMGILYDYYILEEDFKLLDTASKRLMLLKAVVVENPLYGLEEVPKTCLIDDSCVALKNVESKFKYEKNKFSDEIDVQNDTLVLYSIAYDRNWKASVNGKSAEIIIVDAGFMALRLEEGNNIIEFNYVANDFKYGVVISVSTIICLVGYAIIVEKKKEKR